jgi:hypothetical protein
MSTNSTTTTTADAQRMAEKFNGLLSRSATDMAFRKQLLADPHTALAEYAGKNPADVPADFRVVFVENHAYATFVLPDPIDPEAELSAEELEAVAGGTEIVATILACIASAIACYERYF